MVFLKNLLTCQELCNLFLFNHQNHHLKWLLINETEAQKRLVGFSEVAQLGQALKAEHWALSLVLLPQPPG